MEAETDRLARAVPGTFDTPPGWRVLKRAADGVLWRIPGGLTCIATRERHDEKVWMHLSVGHTSRIPTWPELVKARDAVLGEETECYQVVAPASRYVNLNPYVLHLYACDEGPQLPQFDGVVDGTRTI